MKETRAGSYVTNLSGDAAYRSFRPAPLPPTPPLSLDAEGITLLGEASRKVALLDGRSTSIPDIDLFISMYVRKEANLSSQIEGMQCTLEDILDPSLTENADSDVSDVVNYIRAMGFAFERLKTLPLCNRLIREIHAVLMQDVRGCEKTPGEFRISQNWIGWGGGSLRTARYIPPNPEDMFTAMSELEAFMNSDEALDPLIQAALIHYQFETIHPFLDGNGRIGRLLVILFLLNRGILSAPTLYISVYLKQNRVEYYDRLTEVRTKGNYEQWVTFMLRAVADSADDALKTIDQFIALRATSMAKLSDLTERIRPKALAFLTYLEKYPIIETKKAADELGFSYNAAAKYIGILEERGILTQTSKFRKTRIYSYEPYLGILRKGI